MPPIPIWGRNARALAGAVKGDAPLADRRRTGVGAVSRDPAVESALFIACAVWGSDQARWAKYGVLPWFLGSVPDHAACDGREAITTIGEVVELIGGGTGRAEQDAAVSL